MLAKAGLLLAAILAANFQGLACTGPKVLEDKIHAHPDADGYTEMGTYFGEKKQYDCAVEAFQAGLKLEPGSAKLQYLIGLTLYSSGHPQDALKPLGQSIFLMPEVLKPHLLLAAALEQLQRPKEARAEWEAALRIDAHSTVAVDGMSKSLMAEGNMPAAIDLLRSAPRNEEITLDLALAYGKAGMLPKAEELLKQALSTNPGSRRVSEALATVYINEFHNQEAVRVAAKFARLHPRDIEAQKFYLRVLVLASDFSLAGPLARKLLVSAPRDFYVQYMNGIVEVQAGKFAAARDFLQQAVAIDPNHYSARYNLGIALLELKDDQGAKEQLAKAIALGATEPEIHFKYATALRSTGETEAAKEQLKLYQQALKENASHALSASKAAQADGEMQAGDPQKAANLYREAVEASPADAMLCYKWATALDRAGDTVAERAALEKAIQIDPDMAIAQNQLGYLASRSGDSAAAEVYFRQAVRAAPNYTQAWVSLAATLGMQSRFAEAQEALSSALRVDPNNAEALELRKELSAAQANR